MQFPHLSWSKRYEHPRLQHHFFGCHVHLIAKKWQKCKANILHNILKKNTLACGWHILQSTAARSRSSRHEKTNSFKMIEIPQCLASSQDFLSPVPLLSFLHGAMLPSSLSRGWAPGFQRGFCREHKFRGKKERPYSSNQVVLILSFLHTLNA